MKLPAKWKDRLILVGALMWIGFYYHLVALGAGMIIDVIVGMAVGEFSMAVTRRLLCAVVVE